MKLIDFKERFPTEESCKAEFKLIREASTIICKKCSGTQHYWLSKKEMYQCKNNTCRFRTSLKSGSVMENSKLSFTNWLMAMHLMTATKNDFSALELQRQIGHKYYEPIFFMMHKIRLVMGKRDASYTLEGTVEMDEGYFTNSKSLKESEFTGQSENQKRGVGSQKKSKVAVLHSLIKLKPSLDKTKRSPDSIPKYLKMQTIENVDSKTINKSVETNVQPHSELITDDNRAYKGLKDLVETHTKHTVKKVDACKVLPWVHKAISNAKGMIWNVHKGVSENYLQNYLNEYCYKFNRRYFKDKIFDRLIIACSSFTWF
jgi:hypothetical protein